MGQYAITFTETRDAVLYVTAPTVEHARIAAAAEIEDWDFPHGEGYNRWISGTERVDGYDAR